MPEEQEPYVAEPGPVTERPADSLLERVASAQARCMGIDYAELPDEAGPGEDGFTALHSKAFWRGMAWTAVEAMYEPTAAMQEAALRTVLRENKGIEYSPSLGWKAMLAVVIKEGGGA